MGLELIQKTTSINAKEIINDLTVNYSYTIENNAVLTCSASVSNGVNNMTVSSNNGNVFVVHINETADSNLNTIVELIEDTISLIFTDYTMM